MKLKSIQLDKGGCYLNENQTWQYTKDGTSIRHQAIKSGHQSESYALILQ